MWKLISAVAVLHGFVFVATADTVAPYLTFEGSILPPESTFTREERIDRLALVKKYGGKTEFEYHEQTRVAVRKGLNPILRLFQLKGQVLSGFEAGVIKRVVAQKVPAQQAKAEIVAIDRKQSAWLFDYYRVIARLVVGLVPSPEASQLSDEAKAAEAEFDAKYPDARYSGVSQSDLEGLEKTCDRITLKLKALPQLSLDQIRAQFRELPPEEVSR